MFLRNSMHHKFITKSKPAQTTAKLTKPSKFWGEKGFSHCKEQAIAKKNNTHVVFYPPLLGTPSFWDNQTEALRAKGFNNIHHINTLGEDTIDKIVEKNLNNHPKKFGAVVASMGLNILLKMPETYLSGMEGLVIINSKIDDVSSKEKATKQLLIKKWQEVKMNANLEEAIAAVYFPPASPFRYPSEVIQRFTKQAATIDINDVVKQLKATLSRGNQASAFNTILESEIPIYILEGGCDPIALPGALNKFLNSKNVRHCKIETFPRGSHLLPLEYPTEVNKVVLNMVASIEKENTNSAVLSNPCESQNLRMRP